MFFVPVIEFDVPQRAKELTIRAHNKYVKEALRETLEAFHKTKWRSRFQMHAQHKYGYAMRSRKYMERKRRLKGHSIPMLYSGDTRKQTSSTTPKLRLGGSAEGGKKGVSATLFYKLPFKGGSGRSLGGNRVAAQLVKELSRWSEDEVRWAAEFFRNAYQAKLAAHKSSRKRIRTIRR